MKVWKDVPVEKLAAAELANGTKVRFVAGDHSNAPAAEKGEYLPPEDLIKVVREEGGYALHTFTRHTHQPGQMGPTRGEVFVPDGVEVSAYINDPEVTDEFVSTLEPEGKEPSTLDRRRKHLVTELVYRIWEEEQDGRYKTMNFKAPLLNENGEAFGTIYGMGFALYVLVEGLTQIDLHDEDAGGAVPVDLDRLYGFGDWEVY